MNITSNKQKEERLRQYTVVCLGASIVRGQVSYNFINILNQRMADGGFKFINKGFPGDQAYNLLMRIDSIAQYMPDFVIILIGTNDVTAALNPGLARISRLTRKFPQPPSVEFYRENMKEIVKDIKEKTQANIALISLPVLGENLTSIYNQGIKEYNTVLKELADQDRIAYLPVYERQEEHLKKIQKHPGRSYGDDGMLPIKALARHFLLRQSFDVIARKNHYLLLTDGIHMNSLGAAIIADEVELYLRFNTMNNQ